MKYDKIKNPNYVATVIKVTALSSLIGLDNLKAINVFGMQALVSSDVQVGDLGILFSTETQLSDDFVRKNNLYRHSDMNKDQTQTGYMDNNRRVKAIKLRGHRSDSLFMPLSSLKYLAVKGSDFNVGDVFDSINGDEIVRKYYIKEPKLNNGPAARIRRVDLKVFPEHLDSENYWRNCDKIPSRHPIVVTQKLHGTSVRYGNVLVAPKETLMNKVRNFLGIKVGSTHKFVAGSRRVVKSIDLEAESGAHKHFYATDPWSTYAADKGLKDIIPEGFIVYGELVGYTKDGQAIQKNYTYDLPVGESMLYVYRVAVTTPSGQVVDLSWPELKTFCTGLGLRHVPEMVTKMHTEFVPEKWIDRNYYKEWVALKMDVVDAPIPLSDKKTVDEGVCVRYDGPNGVYILKAKSPIFLAHETKMLDEEAVDLEADSNE